SDEVAGRKMSQHVARVVLVEAGAQIGELLAGLQGECHVSAGRELADPRQDPEKPTWHACGRTLFDGLCIWLESCQARRRGEYPEPRVAIEANLPLRGGTNGVRPGGRWAELNWGQSQAAR